MSNPTNKYGLTAVPASAQDLLTTCKRYRFLFANWDLDNQTCLLACLLHDIGTMEANITATRLNFEFFGGVLALRVLQNDTHEDEGKAN
ncbi:hypothetical protein N7516_000954 [Penicillium verrucosum]|uniref:uncharacterized protein n=1 Tax=Penicillium verrucosum TaxID=60171 RepID=UPI002545AECA|nr:uncharacterized protein N7516_000954 [Penicillium verrucosum]KAJ5940786.1 hypothetical protein N7516_000954 [Penicillium verrucosum]